MRPVEGTLRGRKNRVMKFSEKVRALRNDRRMTQSELALAAGLSLRTIQNYEAGLKVPVRHETAVQLASALGVQEKELMDDRVEDMDDAAPFRGNGQRTPGEQARWLADQFIGLCCSGQLPDEELDEVMMAMNDAYWIARRKNRLKRMKEPGASGKGE